MKPYPKGLAARLIILILAGTTVIFLAAFTYNLVASKQAVMEQVRQNVRHLTLETTYRVEAVLRAVEKVPNNLAVVLQNYPHREADLQRLLRRTVSSNPEIFGVAAAFEPYAFHPQRYYFCPYCFRDGRQIKLTYLGSDSYRYFYWDWYRLPKELNHAVWSEPYFDEGGGNIIMSTYSVPFYRREGPARKFQGVVTADVSLMWLKDLIRGIKIYQHGYAFLISRNGVFVTHPDKQLILRENIFSIADAGGEPSLRRLGRNMIQGKSGFVRLQDFFTGKKSWLSYAPVPSTGWSLGVIVPENELFAGVNRLNRKIFGILFLGLVFLALVITAISATIVRPLKNLVHKTAAIAQGDFTTTVPETGVREVAHLARCFNEMGHQLTENIKELMKTTAAKERIESELHIAREIQMSILPKIFPPFPQRRDFDIYAVIEPAKEVGGDFYDFFLLDDQHLCFAIGDVADKGVPASLYMAVTKTLIKAVAQQGHPPGEILTRVNRELASGDTASMFVTVFLGILDTVSGRVLFANGGHNPPLVMRTRGSVDYLASSGDPLVGAVEDLSYKTTELALSPGDALFLYTDGVTEASTGNGELFSEDRLLESLQALPGTSPHETVEAIRAQVSGFVAGAPQADDITMLMVRFQEVG